MVLRLRNSEAHSTLVMGLWFSGIGWFGAILAFVNDSIVSHVISILSCGLRGFVAMS